MVLAIDPGNIESAYVVIDENCKPLEFGKVKNEDMLDIIYGKFDNIKVIEMVASYGMPVGAEVFETCVWIGRFHEKSLQDTDKTIVKYLYRKDVKMNLCHSMKAKDANVKQALVDRFAYGQPNYGKGTKKNPGWFYGFADDVWQAYAVGVTYHDIQKMEG